MKAQDQFPALQKLDVVEHVSNPSALETEAREAGVQGQPQLRIEFKATRDPVSKKKSIIMKNELYP